MQGSLAGRVQVLGDEVTTFHVVRREGQACSLRCVGSELAIVDRGGVQEEAKEVIDNVKNDGN